MLGPALCDKGLYGGGAMVSSTQWLPAFCDHNNFLSSFPPWLSFCCGFSLSLSLSLCLPYILVFSLSLSLFLSLSLSLAPSLSKKSYLLHLLKPGVFFLLTLKYLVSKSVCFCCHLVSKILTLQLSDN